MHILILGAGYAGLRVALDLQRLPPEASQLAVTLVDQNSYHQLVQLLHLAATGALPDHEAIYDLKRLLDERRVRFVQGRVQTVVPLERAVTLDDGRQLPYDRLVIALGAETAYGDTPGAREHSLPLRTYQHALRLREQLGERFTAAAQTNDEREQRVLLTTAIVGGGYTGCQLAGELIAWADELCAQTGAPREAVRVALLERTASLLQQFGAWATREAERTLAQLGVAVYLNTDVVAVEPQLLRVGGERVLRAGTLVWAGGVRGPALLGKAGLAVNAQGRVLVDRYLRVHEQALIFAAGDCAAIPDGSNGIVPATASYATRQGEHLAETLLAESAGRAPRAYQPLKLGELVSLGPRNALGNPLGVPLSGYPALLLKKGVEQVYRASIEPL